ncbi:hypothetical protein JOM49_003030 [Amycolatopsis magusensis]|uniref:Uncharacterized protein n=1 Tax=Amycolatopsis magusensis TaxID=882444 RepID=A0ABS4PQ12_9PSEU|nr:hypothetical protein [Amycolatopsis magusensis]
MGEGLWTSGWVWISQVSWDTNVALGAAMGFPDSKPGSREAGKPGSREAGKPGSREGKVGAEKCRPGMKWAAVADEKRRVVGARR